MVDVGFYTQAQPNALLGTAEQAIGIRNAQQQNQLLQTANQQAHQNLGQQQVQYLAGGLGLLANDPNLTADKMHSFAQNAVQEGLLSPQTYQTEMASIDAAGNDPVALRSLASNYQKRALDAEQQYGAMNGYVPGAGGAQVQYVGPTGATVNTTQAAFDAAAGGGGNSLTAQPSAQTTTSGGGGGNALMPQSTPTGTQAATTPVPLAPVNPNVGAAGGLAGPTPQQQELFKASSAQYQQAKQDAANYQANILPLKKSLDLLPKTPLFGTGAEIPTQVAKVLNTFGIKIGSDQATNASELDKYLTQLYRSSGAAPNSDAQLLAAVSASPNMTTDKAAAGDVLKTLFGFSRMNLAGFKAAQAQGINDNNSEQFSNFVSNWGPQQDPRAYAFDLMDPKAKAALKTELKANPAEAQKFINSYNTAKATGIYD